MGCCASSDAKQPGVVAGKAVGEPVPKAELVPPPEADEPTPTPTGGVDAAGEAPQAPPTSTSFVVRAIVEGAGLEPATAKAVVEAAPAVAATSAQAQRESAAAAAAQRAESVAEPAQRDSQPVPSESAAPSAAAEVAAAVVDAALTDATAAAVAATSAEPSPATFTEETPPPADWAAYLKDSPVAAQNGETVSAMDADAPPVEAAPAIRASGEVAAAPVKSLLFQSLAPDLVGKWESDQEFTSHQEEVMGKFRQRLLDEGHLSEWWDNKPTFYRFCQARGWDLEKAYHMFIEHLKFRQTWGLDEVADGPQGPCSRFLYDFKLPEKPAVKSAYNYSHHKTDKHGRLIYIDRAGSMDMKALDAATSHDSLLKAYVWDCEATMQFRLPACSLAAGKYVGKTLTIIDLKGFHLSLFNHHTRSYLHSIASLSQDNYPELLGKMFIVNTPWVFKTVWHFMGPLLDKRTKQKISIYGGQKEYLAPLLELVESTDLPTFLGGSDTSCDFVKEEGPWADKMPSLTKEN